VHCSRSRYSQSTSTDIVGLSLAAFARRAWSAMMLNRGGRNDTLANDLSAVFDGLAELGTRCGSLSLLSMDAKRALVAATTYNVDTQECVTVVNEAVLGRAIGSERMLLVLRNEMCSAGSDQSTLRRHSMRFNREATAR